MELVKSGFMPNGDDKTQYEGSFDADGDVDAVDFAVLCFN